MHPEKKGIRVFGIAESSRKGRSKSALAGIVMRRDLVIDGVAFGSATISGDDATDVILRMYESLEREDVTCIMIGGLVISMYNIVDGERIFAITRVPVIAVTYEESEGLEQNIKGRYRNWEEKVKLYRKLGAREKIALRTGKTLYVRYWGVNQRKTISILDSFTLQGSIPEPVRVARIAARSLSAML